MAKINNLYTISYQIRKTPEWWNIAHCFCLLTDKQQILQMLIFLPLPGHMVDTRCKVGWSIQLYMFDCVVVSLQNTLNPGTVRVTGIKVLKTQQCTNSYWISNSFNPSHSFCKIANKLEPRSGPTDLVQHLGFSPLCFKHKSFFNILKILPTNYSQISISWSCGDHFNKFELPEVQINLHFG